MLQVTGAMAQGHAWGTATDVRTRANRRSKERRAHVHGLVRACTAVQTLLGDTYRHGIECQVLCGSWGARCSCPTSRVCAAAASPAQAGTEGSVYWWSPRVLPLLFHQARQAAKPRAASQSRVIPPRHPTCLPATPATRTGSSQPAQRSHWDAPMAAAVTAGLDMMVTHSWKEPRTRNLRRAARTLRAQQGRGGTAAGRAVGDTDTHRPALLPREEIINLLGIKSAASQKTILPKRRRKTSRPPPHALPASGPVAFVRGDGPDTRASVWAPRPHARMKRSPGFAQTPTALAPPVGLGAP